MSRVEDFMAWDEAAQDARYAEIESMQATHCFTCGDPLPEKRKRGDGPWCGYECAAHPIRGVA